MNTKPQTYADSGRVMAMSYRIELYVSRLGLDGVFYFNRIPEAPDPPRAGFVRGLLAHARPGTFALVLRIDGDEETVLERWRVSADGRILRAVYDVRERELEQT